MLAIHAEWRRNIQRPDPAALHTPPQTGLTVDLEIVHGAFALGTNAARSSARVVMGIDPHHSAIPFAVFKAGPCSMPNDHAEDANHRQTEQDPHHRTNPTVQHRFPLALVEQPTIIPAPHCCTVRSRRSPKSYLRNKPGSTSRPEEFGGGIRPRSVPPG